jgi:hypothetical protein
MVMSNESWEEQFKQFLRKTGDDFRRTGEDIRAEAQKLLDAAMDPEKQQKVRDRLNELGLWARKTAQGVVGAVGEAASKAETVFHRVTDKPPEGKATPQPPARSASPRRPAGKAKVAKPGKKGGAKRNR